MTLLSRIDYGQLNTEEIDKVIQRFSNVNMTQIIRDKMSLCDISTKVRDKHGLKNLRGMQLCIVKVRNMQSVGKRESYFCLKNIS